MKDILELGNENFGDTLVGHCRDTLHLHTAGILVWALQGYSSVGRCRILCTWALHAAGRCRDTGKKEALKKTSRISPSLSAVLEPPSPPHPPMFLRSSDHLSM